jgi:dUTP pyrophosphatase
MMFGDILFVVFIANVCIGVCKYIEYRMHIVKNSYKQSQDYKIRILDDAVKNYYSGASSAYKNDSGLDLVVVKQQIIPANSRGVAINLGISCEPPTNKGYYLYPRSSISNTPLRLSNSIGIIDCGYRGPIIAKVDNLSDSDYVINSYDTSGAPMRLFQLCTPDLSPFKFKLVSELSVTDRGIGGFGSSNRNSATPHLG